MSKSFWSPILRSRRYGHRHLSAGSIFWIGVSTWLAPPSLMIGVGLLFILIGEAIDVSAIQSLGVLAGLGVAAPFIGLFAVPFALLLGAWALRFGWAGWGVALLAGATLPLILGAIHQILDPTSAAVGTMLILTPIVILHATVLWAATRHFCPASLLE